MSVPRRYPRGSQVHPVVRELLNEGVIRERPRQVDRGDLSSSDGVDIVYNLRNMTPDRFGRYADQLIVAAAYEANRYSDFDYFYAEWQVRLNTGSRRRAAENERSYRSANYRDIDQMIWGESDEEPYELGGQGKSLMHKAEAIINMNRTGSPGAYVNQQNPYLVLRLIISVRMQMGGTVPPLGTSTSDYIRLSRREDA